MAYEKTVSGKLFSGTINESLFIGFSGTRQVGTGVFGVTGLQTSSVPNIMAGHQIWDFACYTIGATVAGGATGGSYTVVVTGNCAGFTGLPIATATVGPNTLVQPFTSLHNGPASIVPTGVSIVQGSTGLMTYDIFVDAKAQRGSLRTVGTNAGRTMEGTVFNFEGPGMSTDQTVNLDTTGSTASSMGLKNFRVIDHAMWWAAFGNTLTGTWDIDVIAKTPNGLTVVVASVGGAAVPAGAIATDYEKTKIAIPSRVNGCALTPTDIIVTEVGAGAVSGRIIVAAKTSRGVQGRK